MPITPHLIRKLEQALGTEAARDLVSQLGQGDNLRADVSELRHEMQLGFAKTEARFVALEQKMDLRLDGLRLQISEQVSGATARLLKWSFMFWVGAVGAIAALAGVLR